MKKATVSIVRCESYHDEEITEAVKRGFDLLGGIDAFFKKGEKVLIKPNLLAAAEPKECVATHPTIFEAIIELLKPIGVSLSYGDSPGIGKINSVSQKTGFTTVADNHAIPLADFETPVTVTHTKALIKGSFPLAKGVVESDALLSVAKLKSHALVRLTGAVKNQYGCIPGIRKAQFHGQLPLVHDLCKFIVDLNTYIKPRFYILDAVMAMEGNGPNSGDPRKIGCLLCSKDPVALDTVACKIINLNPDHVPTNRIGQSAGLGTATIEEIALVGDSIDDLILPTFKVTRKPAFSVGSGGISRFVKARLMPRPVIDSTGCIKCGKCVTICPVENKAVFWHDATKRDRPPQYDYGRCIRCFCCQETCPEKIISVKSTIFEPILVLLSSAAIYWSGIKLIIKQILKNKFGIGKKRSD